MEGDRKLHMKVGVEKETELKSRNIRCVGAGDKSNKPKQEEKKSKKIKKRQMNVHISSRGHLFG